jgi:hypothetical protein
MSKPRTAKPRTPKHTAETGKKNIRYKRKIGFDQVKAALIAGGGVYAQAARNLGVGPDGKPVSRWYVWDYVRREPELQRVVENISEARLDLAEHKLFEKIEQGVLPAINFYLTTKGKDRGYVRRVENTGKDGADLFDPAAIADRLRDDITRKLDRIAATVGAA